MAQQCAEQSPLIDLAVFDGPDMVEAHRFDRVADADAFAESLRGSSRRVMPLSPAAQAEWVHRHRRAAVTAA